MRIKTVVFVDTGAQRLHIHTPSHQLERLRGTSAGTHTAPAAQFPAHMGQIFWRSLKHAVRTGGHAAPAAGHAQTALPVMAQLRLRTLGFRIGTPLATQGTAFEKNHVANAWPVVDGERLNVENDPARFSHGVAPETQGFRQESQP